MVNSSTDNLAANLCDGSVVAACCAQFFMEDCSCRTSSLLLRSNSILADKSDYHPNMPSSVLWIEDYLSVCDLSKVVLRRVLPTFVRRALRSLIDSNRQESELLYVGIVITIVTLFAIILLKTFQDVVYQKILVRGRKISTIFLRCMSLQDFTSKATTSTYQSTMSMENKTNKENRFEYSDREKQREKFQKEKVQSGVDKSLIPRHVAVIMDGNRRFGKERFGNATEGHWQGSKKVVDFAQWCIVEGIETLTLYAFSTENWQRDPAEVSALMTIFCKYSEEIRVEALEKGIRVNILSTETEKIPDDVNKGIERLVSETRHCSKFNLNICLSYGSRGEIVNACKAIAADVKDGKLPLENIDEEVFSRNLLTGHCKDPDIVIRTSGESRLSNFLLWQLAYSELFFLDKRWPAIEKDDFLSIIRTYAHGRQRRFGR